jgi:hypothetical protein
MRVSAILVLSLAAPLAQAPAAIDASKATFSDPTLAATIDTGKLKGEPTQLGWSTDGAQWYVLTQERGADGGLTKARCYVLTVSAPQPTSVANPPEWATTYYNWKSGKAGPGMTGPEIEAETSERTKTATQSAMGGSTYGGGGVSAVSGTSLEGAARRSEQELKERVITLTLSGQTIGTFVNQPLLPGYTFGWAPTSLRLLAYVNEAGHLSVMDMQGGHQELSASKNVILPAWSPDGSQIAYLQRAAKKKWDLYTVRVVLDGR